MSGIFYVGLASFAIGCLMAGYQIRRWLSGAFWLAPSLALLVLMAFTIVVGPCAHPGILLAYPGAAAFSVGWGIGGFVGATKGDAGGLLDNQWISLTLGVVGAVVILGFQALILFRIACSQLM